MVTTVFNLSNTKENAIYPPEQVFLKPDFTYMLTMGGHLAGTEAEYQKLMDCLRKLNEKDFFILENLGATVTERTKPFYAKIPLSSNLFYFDNIVSQFDPIFGLFIYHFFIYGRNDSWGIYLCEYPTINIIGCRADFVKDFSDVFNIKGNGYEALKGFINLEYQSNEKLIKSLITNYHL